MLSDEKDTQYKELQEKIGGNETCQLETIKDPTFNIYAKGGNVENKSKAIRKEQLLAVSKR